MAFYNKNYAKYEGFYDAGIDAVNNAGNGGNGGNGVNGAGNDENDEEDNRNNVVINESDGYDTLYTVDLNFDADIKNMDANVLSDYINRRLSNHPYYIDVKNIVNIDVNEESNKITVTVSNKEVYDKLSELNNTTVNLNSVIEDDMYNYENNTEQLENDIELVNSMYPDDQKYVLEYQTPEGQVQLYEYDFDGFNKAKSLNYDKHVILNGTKKRHFLRNDNDNPFYYDEYMNSEINYVDNNQYNSINPADPMNVKTNLYNQIPENNNSYNSEQLTNNSYNSEEVANSYNSEEVANSYNSEEVSNNSYNSEQLTNNSYNSGVANNSYNSEELANNSYNSEEVSNNSYNSEEVANSYNSEEVANSYNNSLNKIDNKNQYLNYFIIFLILVCVLVIFFIIFNYVFKKK
mgnify:CR=1 FL=1